MLDHFEMNHESDTLKALNNRRLEIAARTCCIVPIYNEGTVIEDCLADLRTIFPNILIIDDGSTDDSASKAKKSGAQVIRHTLNVGQGLAISTGLKWVQRQNKFKNIVTLDGDGQHMAHDALRLVEELENSGLDIVFGSRFLGYENANTPAMKRIILKIVAKITNILTGTKLSDAHNGLRALTVEASKAINLTQTGMAHASQIISLTRQTNLKYHEISVNVLYTPYSRKKGQSILNSVNIVADLVWSET
jgi:glycosyltransferase involved in cell wall biosynthesis